MLLFTSRYLFILFTLTFLCSPTLTLTPLETGLALRICPVQLQLFFRSNALILFNALSTTEDTYDTSYAREIYSSVLEFSELLDCNILTKVWPI